MEMSSIHVGSVVELMDRGRVGLYGSLDLPSTLPRPQLERHGVSQTRTRFDLLSLISVLRINGTDVVTVMSQ
jgi:hypothetical protein